VFLKNALFFFTVYYTYIDIKPENLLLCDGVVKISDFSVSILLSESNKRQLKHTVGTPAFLPPELCSEMSSKIIATALDIWSLGVTLYVFVFGKLPFEGINQIELYNAIRLQRLQLPWKIDPDLEDLLRRMLNKSPAHRPSALEIMVCFVVCIIF